MSTFQVQVVPVTIEAHANADALEIARVGGYRSIVRKGQLQSGDLVAYIPEQAILPEPLLSELGLEGRLAGRDKNRVKAIRLRGVLSQGICYPAKPHWEPGQDVAEELGIVKYEPPIPASMDGEVWAAGFERCMRYDIENIKRYPEALVEGEAVVVTEKIHGTWAQLALMPPQMAHPVHGALVVSSKGLAARGLAFQPDSPDNAYNLYLRAARHLCIDARIRQAFGSAALPVFVLGEIFGQGVQDLAYGATTARDEALGFRVFDVYLGLPGQGRYLDDTSLEAACQAMGLARVPVLYRGPYRPGVLEELTSGPESVSGRGMHLREGVVVRPRFERSHPQLGRVQLKSVSEAYLLRSGGTEFT